MRRSRAITLFQLFVAIILYLGTLSAVRAQTSSNRDVYVFAIRVADDVELIREVMGRPYDDSPRLPASDVSQLELFFQAQTLFRKSNQLAQEIAGVGRQAAPPAPEEELLPADTLAVVAAAYEQIQTAKSALGIEGRIETQRRDTPVSPTGVFMAIIDLNRQLNLIIEEPISPEDVFGQVTLASVYAASALAEVAGTAALPSEIPFDGHKRPADVYGRLLECLDIISEVAEKTGVGVLSLSSRRNLPDDIEPGHVYDIARIVVADLAILADSMGAEDSYTELPTPERIFPTQVYERASLLRQQLEILNNTL